MFKTLKIFAAGSEPILKAMSEGKSIVDLVNVITGTTSAVAGTRTEHDHGLNYTPTVVIPVVAGALDDVDNAPAIAIVSIDATKIVVKATKNSVAFTAYVI